MNGQVPPGYEEIEEKALSMPLGYEEAPKKELKLAKIKPELGDWKKELPGAIKETLGEIPTIKNWTKFITKQVPSGEFWKRAGETARSQLQQFISEKLLDPREDIRKSVMEEKEPKKKVSLKEIGKQGLGFITFLPATFDKFVQNPGELIEKEPLNFIMLATVLGKGGVKAIKTKAARGKPVTGKDIHRIVDEMPEKLLGKKQKLEMKSKIPEQMELSFGKAEITPVQKIITALKEAKPLRAKQEVMYTAERAKRFPKAMEALEKVRGRKGFEAAKAKLKGEMEKVEFESLKLTQADVESLFNQIIDSPKVGGIEKIPAGLGLAKLLGEKGGVVPTAGELMLLNRVFPKELVQTILSKRPRWEKIKAGLIEAANVPRALMASYDLSFMLRQGIFLAARYPKEFLSSFAKQFKLFGSEKAFKALTENIVNRPTYKLAKRGGGQKELALTELGGPLSLQEEAFFGAAMAEKIPIVGLGVRASNRAYTGAANKLRMDVFDHLIKGAEKTGRNPWKEPALVDSIIDFVNAGSGRGAMPKALQKSAVALNTALFSPRLMSSRMSLLSPRFYIKLDKFARRQALQSLFAFAGMTTTVLALAKASGAEVETNLLSPDFGKIKIGDTRIDIMGGFQQYIRTAAQFTMGKTISTTTGKVTKTGEGYKPISRGQIIGRGLEYKLAPVASFAVALYRGRSIFGGPLDIPEEVAKRFVPMVIQDVIDLAREDPELLPVSILGFFGTGIQTYKARKKEMVVY